MNTKGEKRNEVKKVLSFITPQRQPHINKDIRNKTQNIKLLIINNIEIAKYCQEYFGFALPSVLWAKRVSKFESSFKCFCLLCNCVVLIVFILFFLLPCLFGE